ncbi:penicillin-binding protein 1C [Pseudomonas sp. PDM17]|uniref:penicillin-binding protein 1C n=1 Tax=Pseudomonas sp. PDM17 TaxID=2769285 RepID=UPI0017816CD8|nr:penicillin-binding protein 1C [Pseudomonas sp. PDM17]MBD9504224.1 penicillin-binding protein 1C [Pseudomonas sp. PDM17]
MKSARVRRYVRALGLSTGVALLGALLLDRLFPLPLPAGEGGSSVVLARDGKPLRAFADEQGVWRYETSAQQVSPLYLQALLGYEDRWFYQHPGINPYALARGALLSLRHGRVISGGSTLTMQAARVISPIRHDYSGKLLQLFRALQLEAHLSKDEILGLYLNHAPFGGAIEGVEAASWAYLGKSASQLSHAEAALLAVLPQAPSLLRPDRHADAARVARDKVLERMAAQGIWSASEVRDAKMEAVITRSLRSPLNAALLAERLHQRQPGAQRIQSTIDASLQRAVEQRVGDYVGRLPARTSAAVLVMDNRSLETRVYVGTAAFADPRRLGHVDMVRAWRSPGSTLKPFLYGMALDDGLVHSQSLLVDAPQDFGSYRPGNFDEAFAGPVSVTEALQRSLNVPAVDVLDRVGPARFAAQLAAGGLELRLPPGAQPNLAMVLGGTAARLEELVGVYSALANGGVAGAPRYTPEQPLRQRRLLSPGAAWIVRDMLASNPAELPGMPLQNSATARARLAWKTGTSYGYRDAWAIGVTDNWTVGIWVGRPDGTPSPGQYGSITALPLLFAVNAMLPNPGGTPRFTQPASVQAMDICWPLGTAASATPADLCRQRRSAWVLDHSVPPTFAERGMGVWAGGLLKLRVNDAGQRLSAGCADDAERALQIARWPALATPWLSSADEQAATVPPLKPGCAADSLDSSSPIRIAGLTDGSTLRKPSNSTAPLRITLQALGTSAQVQWLLDGRLQASSEGSETVNITLPRPGAHQVTALSRQGPFARLSLTVLAQ